MEGFLTKVPRRWIGALLGLLFALLIIWLGFWRMVFVLLCVGLGYFIGQQFDGDQTLEQIFQRLFPSR
ncbi:MAG: DUF2273 domain-containing protein [Firmicutes bacterium]|nr:DUF2273 domain-containing protein [Bacillota bacterium]HOB35720.1 DUF2273 domain-containing protein [Bacillota bacterium]HPZ90315.1 DUF2273 domain-containing protein [Bacillota bacterium]HQE01820.1 DUF2273 domain-containing protein [Bacillota bacterium]